MDHEKHGCVLHFHGGVRGDHVVSPLWSTSELTVYLHVHRLTSGKKRNTARDRLSNGQWTDASVGEVRGTDGFLRFPVGLKPPAL